jgi:hypothetical protein
MVGGGKEAGLKRTDENVLHTQTMSQPNSIVMLSACEQKT